MQRSLSGLRTEVDERNFGYSDVVAISPGTGALTTLIPKKGEAYGPAVTRG